ncbi:MAG: MFS transporter, partial [Pseudomonadota bacterium]
MEQRANLITPVLVAGCLIMMISFAVRASFGVFQIPIAEEFGWLRAEFSLAIAIQNLAWGIGQPIFGAIAEKLTDRKAIILGAITYAAGLILSSQAVSPEAHQGLNWLIGFG